jgi:hypothetical protein
VLLALIGLIGLVFPTWQYFAVRPLVSQALGQAVGIGVGVWLNAVGHSVVLLAGLYKIAWK